MQELNQVLNSIEKRNSILDSKLEGLAEKIENSVSGLKSQNENLFNMIKNQGLEKIETSDFQKKQQEKDLLCDNLNEQRNRNLKHWRMNLIELETQIKSIESTEETAKRNHSRCGTVPDRDAGVAGMMLDSLLEEKAKQMMDWKIRESQGIRDSDQIMVCSNDRTVLHNLNNSVVFVYQMLKLLYCKFM